MNDPLTIIPTLEAPTFIDNITRDPFTTAVKFYAARLNDSPKAVAFLADKFKLTIEQAAQLQVGFSDRRLGKTLPSKDSQAGRELRSRLEAIGLYKSTGHETLRGCVTFPLFDVDGNITGIYGRRIDKHGKGPQEITVGEGTRHANFNNAQASVSERRIEEDFATKEETSSLATPDSSLILEADQVIFTRDDRRYRVRGLDKNTNACTLKAIPFNVYISRGSCES